MQRIETTCPGVWILEPRVFEDARGFFLEVYNEETYAEIGITHPFVQDNHSRSTRGVLRGLHYQIEHPQAKLVRCTRGRIFDVAVDVRKGSPTFGRWTGAELTEANKRMLYIPVGFAHGFLVLSETAEVQYKAGDFYCPGGERGLIWNDPAIGIDWPLGELGGAEIVLSKKDEAYGPLAELPEADLPPYEGGA